MWWAWSSNATAGETAGVRGGGGGGEYGRWYVCSVGGGRGMWVVRVHGNASRVAETVLAVCVSE